MYHLSLKTTSEIHIFAMNESTLAAIIFLKSNFKQDVGYQY